jgi:ribonuclease J
VKITVFDGACTIGGNKIYVEERERGLFLDFGMNFAKYSQFYEEYVSERPARGIYDLWHLGLIPRINNYRVDLIPSDLRNDVSRCQKLPTSAILLSHAHLDHAGNIALLEEEIAIVGSPVTMAILKAINDTGGRGFGTELPYYRVRTFADENEYTIRTDSRSDYPSRKVILTEKCEELEEFLFYRPGQESPNAKKIVRGEICTLDEVELGFEVRAFPVDHSVYGALAYVVEGDISIAYTGDFRLHGQNGEKTRKFIREAKNASILITEGTRVSRDETNVSEAEVYENAKAIVEEAKGLVVADFSPRNFERLEIFKKIAGKTGRELVITPKDAYFLHALKLVDGIDRLEGLKIYGNFRVTIQKWEQVVVMKNYSDSYVSPFEIRKNQENYILCFSFYDFPHLLDIMPNGGVYIYSSSEAFGEEQTFSFLRLWNWLQHFGFEVHGFRVDRNGELIFKRGLHASGHLSKEELVEVIEKIDPDRIIPVHTENPQWFAKNFEKAVVMRDGETVVFN